MNASRAIALVGLMGAGKSTVARLLAARLGGRAVDLDQLLETEAGCSVAELFRRDGEAGFRRREAARLSEVLASPPAVLACGGGTIVDPASRERLKEACRVVWLEVSAEEALRRVGRYAETRPMLHDGAAGLEALLRGREAAYREVAEIRVPTDGRTPDQVVQAVIEALAGVAS
jgi:shikimate kinase